MSDARKVWLKIALYWFPYRHHKISSVRQNARGMLFSMFAHGKNWRLWKAGLLKNKNA